MADVNKSGEQARWDDGELDYDLPLWNRLINSFYY